MENACNIYNITQLLAIRDKHAALSCVQEVEHGYPDWSIQQLKLKNNKSDYFSIALYKDESDNSSFLIRQRKNALIMLLVADVDGQPAALLNIRFEPGLIGKVNYTTTIQSTPNNYLREHGGKPTPFIEISNTPESYGEILYDAEQFDWGEFYLGKTKRFLIVKLKEIISTPHNFFWVGITDIPSLMLKDNLITSDLRAILPLLLHPHKNEPRLPPQGPSTTRNKSHLKKQLFYSTTKDTRGVGISYYRSTSENREVSCWVQPLLSPRGRMHICLTTKNNAATQLYAIQLRTQLGLTGRPLWFPAVIADTDPYIKITTCAEGGRFWQYPIDIELRKLGAKPSQKLTENKSISWVTKAELMEIAHTALASSLELRIAISTIFVDIQS